MNKLFVIIAGIILLGVVISAGSGGSTPMLNWATSGTADFGTNTVKGNAFTLNDLQSAPSSASDTGTKGEIRVTSDAIYVCIDTDTWVKADLATWS